VLPLPALFPASAVVEQSMMVPLGVQLGGGPQVRLSV
jgi:hypothetical protein